MCWTNPSQDEHSCLAESKAGVNSLEIFIHITHIWFQLILIDLALSVQMNHFCNLPPNSLS